MTKEEINAKVAELSQTYGKVTPIVINANDEQVVGYFKEASYDHILYCTDCIANKEMTKGAEALIHGCLIKEASDMRITDKVGNPQIAASFALAAMKLLKIFTSESEVKKN